MKVYTKVVIDMLSGEVLHSEWHTYSGEVALASSKPSAPKPEMSASGKIVQDLYGRGPLRGSLEGILANPADDPYFQRQAQLGTQQVRGGFGARGLAGSGIASRAEGDFLKDLTLGRMEQKSNQAIQILGTGGTSPQFGPQQQPRGFLGLK